MADKKTWTIPGAHFGGDPEFFTAWTLFDIGMESAAGRSNLQKFIDLVSSRGQPILSGVEMIPTQDIDGSFFGKIYQGEQTVWSYKWIVDRKGVMTEDTLVKDANNTPMTIGLNETVTLTPKIITSGPETNTFFVRHDSL